MAMNIGDLTSLQGIIFDIAREAHDLETRAHQMAYGLRETVENLQETRGGLPSAVEGEIIDEVAAIMQAYRIMTKKKVDLQKFMARR